MNGGDAVMPERSGRVARRMSLHFSVTLEGVEITKPKEVAHTQNVSPLGLQALTRRVWRTREEALVSVEPGGPRRRAWVIYCIPREDGKFMVGLALNGPPIEWANIPRVAAD